MLITWIISKSRCIATYTATFLQNSKTQISNSFEIKYDISEGDLRKSHDLGLYIKEPLAEVLFSAEKVVLVYNKPWLFIHKSVNLYP